MPIWVRLWLKLCSFCLFVLEPLPAGLGPVRDLAEHHAPTELTATSKAVLLPLERCLRDLPARATSRTCRSHGRTLGALGSHYNRPAFRKALIYIFCFFSLLI